MVGKIASDSPPLTYGRISSCKINGVVYTEYIDHHTSEWKAQKRNWYPLQNIHQLYYPFSYVNLQEAGFLRFGGYLPIIGFYAGYGDMQRSLAMIYSRVILNNNQVSQVETIERNNEKRFVLLKITDYKAELSQTQRAALLAMSIALFIRGIITFCQLGFLFIPFDLLSAGYDIYFDTSKPI